MCDRIAIMDKGQIIQIATPTEMYHSPRTAFVAGFLGNPPMAFLRGRLHAGAVVLDGDRLTLAVPHLADRLPDGASVMLGLRPENYGPQGDLAFPGTVVFVETQGRENLYDVRLPDGSLLRSIQPVRADISVGDEVNWAAPRDKIMVFAEDGTRL